MNRARIETIAGMSRLLFALEVAYWGVYGGPITFDSLGGKGKVLRRQVLAAAALLNLTLPDSTDIDPREWAQTALTALRIAHPESESLIEATYLLGYLGTGGTKEHGERYLADLASPASALLGADATMWLRRLGFPMHAAALDRAYLDLIQAEYRRQSGDVGNPGKTGKTPAMATQGRSRSASDLAHYRGAVDFVIVTIKAEEFRAVQKRLDLDKTISGRRDWNMCRVVSKQAGRDVIVATVRQIDQGTNEAYGIVSDAIADLDPSYILVVGIAGAIPGELTLGDVVFGKHIHDLTVQEVKSDGSRVFSIKGGGTEKSAQITLANLDVSLPPELHDLGLPPLPPVSTDAKIYGDEETARTIRARLRERYGDPPTAPTRPYFTDGEIASSDTLVKYNELVDQWRSIAKHISAVEMESAGAYRASRTRSKQYPVIPIRAISDVIGLQRDEQWTLYACEVAAAFALAFIRSLPLPHRTRGTGGGRRSAGPSTVRRPAP